MKPESLTDEQIDTLLAMWPEDSIALPDMCRAVEAVVTARWEAMLAAQEPIGEVIHKGVIRWADKYPEVGTKLYAAPQPAHPKLDEIEQYRMQMAGISTAAYGYWTEGDGIHPDYDTVALRDVAKLYSKYAKLHTEAQQDHTALLRQALEALEWEHGGEPIGTLTADAITAIKEALK